MCANENETKISQQRVLAPVFLVLVYTLQSDNNLTHLNEIILKNGFFWLSNFALTSFVL
jgi:hypothetical protein